MRLGTWGAFGFAIAAVLALPATAYAQDARPREGATGTSAVGGWSPAVQVPAARAGGPLTAKRRAAETIATAAVVAGDATLTTFVLTLSKGVRAEVYTLDAPRRVVVDLPDVTFRLPGSTGEKGSGLVSAFRYGLIEAGKGRIVMDLAAPARIHSADVVPGGKVPGTSELRIVLLPADAAAFAAAAELPARGPIAEPAAPRRRKLRPVVVIDPGHGGIDPGARGASAVQEKAVTLAVARALRQILGAGGRYDVHMTRAGDVFVSLDQRLRVSRRLNADLFISIHADSIAAMQFAQSVRGATVYTLSDKASDEEARLLAEKENAVDKLAGMETMAGEDKDQVRSILVDLLKRETSNFSHAFSRLLVDRMRVGVPLSKEPERAAAFKVLRQTDTPSVLIELGYMSNAEDEKLLLSAEWQRQVATSVAAAVETYFANRTAGGRE